jgi:hypothetical protein
MTSIDDFQQQICALAPTHTQEAIREWLQQQGVRTTAKTIARRLHAWQAGRYTKISVNHPDYEQLIDHVNYLFHHQPTYSDSQIARRIKEEYSLYTTARQVKEIRLLHQWNRRQNDPELREAFKAETERFIHELLLQGQIRSYGRRQLITHLARKYGFRPQGRHVRIALQTLDSYANNFRKPGMKRRRRENYIVNGPDWLWCLDGHEKLSRFGIDIYGCIDGYSRKIIWFFVGSSSRTQVSVLSQYLNAIDLIGYCPNFLRTDRGREVPMMADAHYHFYWQALVDALGDYSTNEDLDAANLSDCYIFGKSTANIRIEGLWGHLIGQETGQWIDYFHWLEGQGYFREDIASDKVILLFIFIPILRAEVFDWVEDHNSKPIRPDHTRNKHVAGIPNDLYRGDESDEAKTKKGFTYNRATHDSFTEDIAGYGKYRFMH